MKYVLTAEHNFEASHNLIGHNGGCRNVHGHSYQVKIEVGGDTLIESGSSKGMVMDFTDIKNTFKKFVDGFDHCHIIQGTKFQQHFVDIKVGDLEVVENCRVVEVPFRTTVEEYTKFFYDELTKLGIPVHAITIWETRNNACRYQP